MTSILRRAATGGIGQAERIVAVLLIAALFFVPYLKHDPYQETVATLILLNAILAMSLTVLFGCAGQLSFAYAALYGVGAYASTYAIKDWHVPQLVGIALGGVAALVVGLVVALPALRIRGLQLGLVTLAFSLAATTVFAHISGYEGIVGLPYFHIGHSQFIQADRQLILLAVLAVVTYVLLSVVLGRRTGRRFLLVKADEASASSLGLNVTREKMLAFALSSLVLGIIGGFYPMLLSFLGPELFSFELVTTLFLIVIVGGAVRLEGAILGATIFGLIRVALKNQAQLTPVLYGGGMLLTLLFLPGGLIGLFTLMRRQRNKSTTSLVPKLVERSTPVAAVADAAPLLEVEAVTMDFRGLRALEDVSLHVQPGEIVGLIGSNGAGKSTLINIITGYLASNAGTIRFSGEDVTRRPPHKRARLGLVRTFQFPVLVPELSVRENLLVAAEASGRERPRARVDEVLELVGLTAADADVTKLPFGIQKVVDLARVLLTGSRVVLLDEPAAGLAPHEFPAIAGILAELRNQGMSVLVVEHNMSFVMPLIDRAVVLDHGRVIATGTPTEIAAQTEVIEAYLGQPIAVAGEAVI